MNCKDEIELRAENVQMDMLSVLYFWLRVYTHKGKK